MPQGKPPIVTAFCSDALFDPKLANRQGNQLVTLVRWCTLAEVLIMATSTNAGTVGDVRTRESAYPGKLGVLEEGALADLLLVDGDPIANINLVADPNKNFLVIMRQGLQEYSLR